MKKLLMGVAAALGLLVAVLLVLPGLMDWNAYKSDIASWIGAATGRDVRLAGDLRFSVLPSPTLTIEDARLASPPGFALPDMARLGRLDVKVDLLPLLGGRVQVRSVTLVEPVFMFEVGEDGRPNWDFAGRGGGETVGDAVGGGYVPSITFDQVTIENGSVVYRDARTGLQETVEAIDARVMAGSFAGPFQMQGAFTVRGTPVRGEMTTGRFTAGAAVPVRVSLGVLDSDATLRFAGIVPGNGEPGGRTQGDLRAEGGSLSASLRRIGLISAKDRALPAPLTQAFAVRASVEVTAGTISLGGVDLQLGDARAAGRASVTVDGTPDVQVALSVNRLDLDPWLAGGDGGDAPGAAAGSDRPAGPLPADRMFAFPDWLTASVDLGADTLVYRGEVVRQARLEARLHDGALRVDRLGALLPGGSDVVAAGTVGVSGGRPHGDLRVEANADDLRGLLGWLGVDVSAVPADRLRKATLAARIEGRPDRLDVTGIDLRVDATQATGGIAYADRGRPAFGIQLDIDRLNLDAYRTGLAEPAPAGSGARGEKGASAGNGAPGGRAGDPLAVLRSIDAHVRLSAGSLTMRTVVAQGLVLDATVTDGALAVTSLKADDLAGIRISASGQLAGLSPASNGHLTVALSADSLAGLARLVPWPSGVPSPEKLGAVTFEGRFAGDRERVAVDIKAQAGGGSVEIGGEVVAPTHEPRLDLKARATHGDLGRLAQLLSDRTGEGGTPASADLYAEIQGGRRSLTLSAIQGIVAGTAVNGQVTIDAAGATPRVDAALQTGNLDLDRFAVQPESASAGATGGPARARAVELDWLRRFDGRLALTMAGVTAGGVRLDDPALNVTIRGGVVTLDQLDGGFMGGQVGATGKLSVPADGVPAGELAVTVIKAKPGDAVGAGGVLALAGGTLDADVELRSSGRTSEDMLRALSGTARVAARDGVLHGFDMAALAARLTSLERPQDAVAALARGLEGGNTPFARLDGTFTMTQGVARTQDIRLSSPVGGAGAAGSVDLVDQAMDLRVRIEVAAETPVPPLSLRLTGPLAAPTRAFDMRDVQDFIVRRAAERATGGVLPNTAPPPGAPPVEIMRGLLEGLGR